jgi:tetratricopeptide (TPR) repeat protein
LNPNEAEAYGILARVAYEKGQLDETVRLCQEALKRGPPNPELLNQLGRALMDLGRTDEAIQTLQQAVRLPRPVSQTSYLLGQAKLQSGNYAEAKESFQRAIVLLPDHTQAYFGLYTACMRLGQTEEAARYREQFQNLEAIDRRSLKERSAQEDSLTGLPMVRETVARTFFGAGQIYGAHQQPAQAAELFRRAASLDGDNPMYRAALEAYYLQRKALSEGVSAFEQLALEQPDNALNYLFLGRMQGRLQQFEGAEAAYLKVKQLAPEWDQGYRALAELYLLGNRKLPEAQVLARRAVELAPSGAHYYLLARVCLKNGDRPAALEAAKHAVALSPGEKRYQELLQQLGEAK